MKNTSNNSMQIRATNPTDSSNNTDVGWTQKVSKRNHSDSSEPKSPDPTLNKKKNNKLFITANRYEVLTPTESSIN